MYAGEVASAQWRLISGGLQSYLRLGKSRFKIYTFLGTNRATVVSQQSVLLFFVLWNVVVQISLIFGSPFAGAKLGLLATQIEGRRGGDCDDGFGLLHLVGRCPGFLGLPF